MFFDTRELSLSLSFSLNHENYNSYVIISQQLLTVMHFNELISLELFLYVSV